MEEKKKREQKDSTGGMEGGEMEEQRKNDGKSVSKNFGLPMRRDAAAQSISGDTHWPPPEPPASVA